MNGLTDKGWIIMAVLASIDVNLITSFGRVSTKKVLMSLYDFGWSFDDHGKVSYLPIGDEDNFSWKSEQMSTEDLLEIIELKEKMSEVNGVTMTWKNTGIGGDFLFWTDGNISINLTVNRKLIDDEIKITDVNWYLTKLLPPLKQNDVYISSFRYEECR